MDKVFTYCGDAGDISLYEVEKGTGRQEGKDVCVIVSKHNSVAEAIEMAHIIAHGEPVKFLSPKNVYLKTY